MNSSRKKPLNIALGKMLSQANTQVLQKNTEGLRHISLDLIQPGRYQPRQDFDQEKLQELAESIKAQGVIQPIVLRQIKPQQYEIIAGERRWRAAQLASLVQIPAIVKEITDRAALAIGLIENIQREDLNVLEEAIALQRLIEEFDLTHEEVAQSVSKSRAMVSNLLRLLQLEDSVKLFIERGEIEMGHGRALLSLPKEKQRSIAKEIIEKQLSVRQTEALVKKYLMSGANTTKVKTSKNPNLHKLEQELSDKLGTRVHFQHQNSGRGKLVIEYANLDSLDGVLKKLR